MEPVTRPVTTGITIATAETSTAAPTVAGVVADDPEGAVEDVTEHERPERDRAGLVGREGGWTGYGAG